LEKLALKGTRGAVTIPASVKGYDLSFSGPLSAAIRLVKEGAAKEDIALAAFHCIAKALEKIIRPLILNTTYKEVLFVGGVAANKIIRARLRRRLEHPAVRAKLYFASPGYSVDSGIGTALLGWQAYHKSVEAKGGI
jgi:N6-L-threonylcarbamoyladenine synthase